MGKLAVFQSFLYKARQMLAGLQYFLQKLAVAVSIVQRLGNAHRNITRIQDRIAEGSQPAVQVGDSHCAWPHVHTAPARAQVERNAYDSDGTSSVES